MTSPNLSGPTEAVRAVAFLNIHFIMHIPQSQTSGTHTKNRKGETEMEDRNHGVSWGIACGDNGSEHPSTASTGFLSAINSDQMSCSELPLINYVRSHMLGSRS